MGASHLENKYREAFENKKEVANKEQEVNKPMSLTEFLLENPVDNLTTEVKGISSRLKGFAFKISAMTGAEFNGYQKQSNQIRKKGRVDYDPSKFNLLLIKNHCLEPNFKSIDFLKEAKCQTPEQAIEKFLLAGEQAELAGQITEFSGFDRDIEELREEVKNS